MRLEIDRKKKVSPTLFNCRKIKTPHLKRAGKMVNENFSVSHSMHYFNNRMWINFVADGKSQKKDYNERQTTEVAAKCSMKNAKNYEINFCSLFASSSGGNYTEFFSSCCCGFFSGFSSPFPVATCRCGKLSLCRAKKKKDDNISGSGKLKTRSNTTMRLVLFSKVYKRGKQNF